MAGAAIPGAGSRRTHRPSRRPLALTLRPGGLRRIGAEQAVFQGRAIKPADNRVHLLRVGSIDESEALGLLRFGIADHFNCVRNQIFGGEPSSDIVRGHPNGQVAQENGKTHSMVVFDSMRGFCFGGTPTHYYASTLSLTRKRKVKSSTQSSLRPRSRRRRLQTPCTVSCFARESGRDGSDSAASASPQRW
jgi:hypothetical protein